jgi:hypothetical protein
MGVSLPLTADEFHHEANDHRTNGPRATTTKDMKAGRVCTVAQLTT